MERSQSSSAVKFSTFNTTIVEKQKQTQFWNVQVKNEFLNGQDTVETVNKIWMCKKLMKVKSEAKLKLKKRKNSSNQ